MIHSVSASKPHVDGELHALHEHGEHHLHGLVLQAVEVHRHVHKGGELQAQHEPVVHQLGCYQHRDL